MKAAVSKSPCRQPVPNMNENPNLDRIIIIDDEIRMGDSLSALLTDAGYAVEAFQNPLKALEHFETGRFDLVIADIKMPQMSGLEILDKVKAADDTVPVILMTAFASLNTAVEAISRGAYDYLVKPIEFAQLELAVKRALDKRRSDLSRSQLVEGLRQSNKRLERHVDELNALYEAGKSIGSAANHKELLNKIVELAAGVTEARVGSVMLFDDNREHLLIEAAIGLDPEIVAKTKLTIGSSIAGYVAQYGKPLMVDDVENNDRFKRINNERYGAASLICVPLQIKNKVLGVINMANKKEGKRFTSDDLRLLATFAAQVAVTVDDATQFERNRRRLVEFQILHELNAELPKIKTMNQFRRLLAEKLNRVFRIDYFIWLRYEADTKTLVPESARGIADIPLTDSGGIDLGSADRAALILQAQELDTINIDDIKALTEFISNKIAGNKSLPRPKQVNMAIPVLKSGELAVILFFGADSEKPYDTDDESLARLVISQAGLLFEREKSLLNATRLVTMGNMISEISHDLRKPLTSIKGTLQIIRQKWPDIFEKSEYFKSAEEEIHRLNELVRELVNFSNPKKYQTEKVDLRSIVARAAELIAPDLKRGKVRFACRFEKANWETIVNKNQILEAILNLFLNAVEAMPEGGELSVHGLIEQPEHKKIEYLAVRIADSGVGIKKEEISHIFDRYYTTKETGTGLGLSVVERIISAHGGTLKVESIDGEGTTFILYFPLEK